MFQTVNSRVSFPEMEKRILELWKSKDIFKRSIEARRNGPRFTLYEGPPTANGSPGIHHVLSRAFKDVIPRYKVMKGYYAPRIGGWDTHGLPVELEVERQLGFTSKSQIEEYGIGKFNELCRNSVFGYLEDWNDITERIAYWVDLDNAYVTMNNTYIESVWWALKQMWDKGLMYQGYKVTPHCPRCGTSLSLSSRQLCSGDSLVLCFAHALSHPAETAKAGGEGNGHLCPTQDAQMLEQRGQSGRADLNRRPQRPERCALTNCATPRWSYIIS